MHTYTARVIALQHAGKKYLKIQIITLKSPCINALLLWQRSVMFFSYVIDYNSDFTVFFSISCVVLFLCLLWHRDGSVSSKIMAKRHHSTFLLFCLVCLNNHPNSNLYFYWELAWKRNFRHILDIQQQLQFGITKQISIPL